MESIKVKKESIQNVERANDTEYHSMEENNNNKQIKKPLLQLPATPLQNELSTLKTYIPSRQIITFLNLPDKYNCVDVIVNRDLFQHIMTFASGLPIEVKIFKKKHCRVHMDGYLLYEGNVKDKYYGLFHRAIELNNINVAKKVWKLWKVEKNVKECEVNQQPNLRVALITGLEIKLDNYVDIMHWVLENKLLHIPGDLLTSAVRSGSMKMIKLIHEQLDLPTFIAERSCDIEPHAPMYVAAELGRLSIVEYFHSLNLPSNAYVMDIAAENGHLNIVKFLSENRTEGCTVAAMDSAAKNGHAEIVKYLVRNRSEGCTDFALNIAVHRNYVEVVEEILTLKRDWSNFNDNIMLSVRKNSPQMLKHFFDIMKTNADKIKAWRQAMEAATRGSHSSCLKILLELNIEDEVFTELRYETLTFATRLAAKLGYLDVFILLLEHSRSLSDNPITQEVEQMSILELALSEAASHGHAGLVVYIRAKYFGDNWSDEDINLARSFSHDLEKITFGTEMDVEDVNPDPSNTNALDRSVFTGNVEIVRLMYQYGAKSVSEYAMGNAVRNGNADIVKFLNEVKLWNLDTPMFMNAAAEVGQLDVVKCLHSFGATCTERGLIEAARNGHVSVTQFLHENRHKSEEAVVRAFEGAVIKGEAEVVEYLLNFVKPETSAFELGVAAMHGHLEIVKLIITKKLINKRALKKALTSATMAGNLEIVKILYDQYEKGSDQSSIRLNDLHKSWKWSPELVNTVLDKKYNDLAKFIFQTAGNDELNIEGMLMMACEAGDLEWTKDIWLTGKCENAKEVMQAATILGQVQIATYLLNEIRISNASHSESNFPEALTNDTQASFSLGKMVSKKPTASGKTLGANKRIIGHRRRK